jgi:hypothetical protein
MTVYEIVAFVDRGWWVIDATDVGVRGRAKTIADIAPTARALVADALDVAPASFDIEILIIARGSARPVRLRERSDRSRGVLAR